MQPSKTIGPEKPVATITPYNDYWIVSTQWPGSTVIFSKNFKTENEAVKYANDYLQISDTPKL